MITTMKIQRTPVEKAFDIFNYIFLAGIAFIMLYPMWHVLVASFSDNAQLMKHSGLLFRPLGFSIDAYWAVFENPAVLRGYRNTLFVLVCGCALNMVLSIIAAYLLSRKDFKLVRPLTIMIVITMYFGGGLIPFYLTVRQLGMDGTLWALFVPTAINTFNVIILKTAFAGIPPSLEESAKIDGARHVTVLTKIVVPLSLPSISVILLYYGVQHWNSWFHAMIFLSTKFELYPLQLVLRQILIQNTTADANMVGGDNMFFIGEALKYALIVVATFPILMVYPFLQKYFVKGVLVGAVKE